MWIRSGDYPGCWNLFQIVFIQKQSFLNLNGAGIAAEAGWPAAPGAAGL
jgi:hypothetical protein